MTRRSLADLASLVACSAVLAWFGFVLYVLWWWA